MAAFYPSLNDDIKGFISQQKMFFVATATATSRVNLSPKGIDTFACLDDHTVGYLDLTGSGNETAAHVNHDGRITFMFCSFDKTPRILRLYGRGRVIGQTDPQWEHYLQYFAARPGMRQIIISDLDTVHTSCGFGIPLYTFIGERPTLQQWSEKKGPEGIRRYWQEHNLTSIDGLDTGLSIPESPER